jgi:nucleotide-binding universal stress UspA family protein
VVTAVVSGLAQSISAALHVVTVRRFPGDELYQQGRPRAIVNPGVDLKVRHGEVVEQVMAEVRESHPDVVAIGYHRGGVPIDCRLGGTATQLAHAAPCVLLTVPL